METSLFLPSAIAFAVALPTAALATRLVLAWLHHKQIFDHPNERSSHSHPTPRGGGLAIAPVALIGWAILVMLGEGSASSLWVIGAGFGLLALSWRDDRGGLSARLRFAMHFLAAGVAVAALPSDQMVFQGFLPLAADRAAAAIGLVWFINLYNFMDGIDGITGVETLSIGGGLMLLALFGGWSAVGMAPLAAVVAACGLGFLAWNWHPAKIFLGDSGSVPLGLLLGWLLLMAAAQGHWAEVAILPAYYLADATLTLGRRAARGEKIWQAHRQHFYQQAVRGGARHNQVALTILGTNIVLGGLAWAAGRHPWPALFAATVLVALVLVLFARIGRREGR